MIFYYSNLYLIYFKYELKKKISGMHDPTLSDFSTSQTFIVLICGAPGIGKSTFCQKLSDYSKANKLRTLLISYDELVDSELEACFISKSQSSEWKQARQLIACLVKNLVCYLNLRFVYIYNYISKR